MISYLFILAVSLSLDAFSLSLSIGNLLVIKNKILLSIFVGIFHFIMPTLGQVLGEKFFLITNVNLNLFTFVIFLYIGLVMLKEYFSNEDNYFKFNYLNACIFSFGVSLDSFGVGMTLQSTLYLKFLIFSIVSFSFTIIGLLFSIKLKQVFKRKSLILGSILMLLLAFVNLCKLFL